MSTCDAPERVATLDHVRGAAGGRRGRGSRGRRSGHWRRAAPGSRDREHLTCKNEIGIRDPVRGYERLHGHPKPDRDEEERVAALDGVPLAAARSASVPGGGTRAGDDETLAREDEIGIRDR